VDATGAMDAVRERLVHRSDQFDIVSIIVWATSDCQSSFDSLSIGHGQ
jgi:hypothetical protein